MGDSLKRGTLLERVEEEKQMVWQRLVCFKQIFDRTACVCVCLCACDVLQISAVFASVAACLGFTIDGLLWAFPADVIENACIGARAQLQVKYSAALQTT